MWLFLEVQNGDQSGEKYPLREGSRLGRTTGEIILNDKKISSLHAQIERDKSGQLTLVDKGSSNGIVLNGEKVARVIMMPGVTFRLGKTNFKVVEGNQESVASSHTKANPSSLHPWQLALSEELPKMLAQNGDAAPTLGPFNPAVRLDFLSGPQADKSILLGYGPRTFGAASLDVELEDPAAPFQAFEILAEAGEPRIISKDPSLRLNKRHFTSEILKEGDLIQFASTEIKVSFAR